MHCKNCDYPLWNLKARQCPECGVAFLPSEFQFVVNSVRFCCAHCDQAYYGTGANGHLVPLEFNCVTCGRRISMDEMVLRPAAGLEEHHTQVSQMPWLERRTAGSLRGWLRTVGLALVKPGRLMRATPPSSSIGQALWFALICTLLTWVIAVLPLLGLMLLVGGMRGGGGAPAASGFVAGMAGMMLGGAIATLISLAIWTGIAHVLLLGGNPAHGIARTFQAICYSNGANIITAVPCVGIYVGWIWWLISAVLMVKEGQKVSGLRASLAVLTFPVLALATVVGLYIWMIFMISSTSMAVMAAANMQGSTQAVTSAIVSYAAAHNNAGPPHAAMLVSGGYLSGPNLVDYALGKDESLVPVAGMTLDRFEMLPTNRRNIAAQQAADALPANVIAHRLGEFVFTYHGIDLSNPPAGLWLVVMWPDPDVSRPVTPSDPVLVGLDNGTTQMVSPSFDAALAAQNVLRSRYGLAPLPHPATVKHQAPATGAEAADPGGEDE